MKRGRKRETPANQAPGDKRQPEIAVPMFGYKNHVGVDREHGLLRRYVVTHAARYDGSQLGAVLDRDNTASDVWADTAYRSAANLTLLERRGLRPQFQRKKPRGKKMPRTSSGAMPRAPGCDHGSSMSSPPRNAASGYRATVGMSCPAKIGMPTSSQFRPPAWLQDEPRRVTQPHQITSDKPHPFPQY